LSCRFISSRRQNSLPFILHWARNQALVCLHDFDRDAVTPQVYAIFVIEDSGVTLSPYSSRATPEPMSDTTRTLIERWKQDPNGTYQSWFLWPERLKNFRSIRRGIGQVVKEIDAGRFGNAYRGSSLETVVGSIAEQRQIFRGADHAFLWKPKLRIPDIYENPDHQRAFGRLLHTCGCCSAESEIIDAIRLLDAKNIKGLGPAVANLLYFIHPTIVVPFNTAIVKGYNALTGGSVKLGRWDHYLAMRQGLLDVNQRYRDLLSNDLGAIGGLMFDMGMGRYPPPPPDGGAAATDAWERELAKVRAEAVAFAKVLDANRANDESHTQIQGWLRDLGRALGFAVWIASNDQSRPYASGRLADGCLTALPPSLLGAGAEAIRLIDVIWLEQDSQSVAAAFEVEHTTSIYSGIVRLLDLAMCGEGATRHNLFLVAPDEREPDVRQQLSRPAFAQARALNIRYLPYGELRQHRDSMARFGSGIKPLEAISRAY